MKRYLMASVLASCVASTGSTETICLEINELSAMLDNGYGEQVRVIARSVDYSTAFFVNPETGTWTTVVVDSANVGCIVANGVGVVEVPYGENL